MKVKAGLLVYRIHNGQINVLLGHPGGPFWKNKDVGAWSIPKGEVNTDESLFDAAKREFSEETGLKPEGEFTPIGSARMKSGKIMHVWALEADPDLASFSSNTFVLTWPPKSGKMLEFPELDRLEWFSLDEARTRIVPPQIPFIDQLDQLKTSK